MPAAEADPEFSDQEEEEGEEEYGSDSEDSSSTSGGSSDPRLSLATTATMQTLLSETATDASSDSDDGPDRRRTFAAVGIIAWFLLPRSSKVALSCSATAVILVGLVALVACLALVDRHYVGIERATTTAALGLDVSAAAASVHEASAAFVLASLAPGSSDRLSALVSSSGHLPSAIRQLSSAALVEEQTTTQTSRTAVTTATKSTGWTDAMATYAAAHGPLPPHGGLLAEATQLQQSLPDAIAQATHRSAVAAGYESALVDAAIGALDAVAALEPPLPSTSDANLLAAATAASSTATTVTALQGNYRAVASAIGLSSSLLISLVPLSTPLPFVDATIPLINVSSVTTQTKAALIAQQRAFAVVDLVSSANATLMELNATVGALAAVDLSAFGGVGTVVQTFGAARDAVNSLLSAVAAAQLPTANPSLVEWISGAEARSKMAPLNTTPIALLVREGLATDDFVARKVPWLAARSTTEPLSNLLGAARSAGGVSGVRQSVDSLAEWLTGAAADHSTAQQRDTEETDTSARDSLIAVLVSGVVLCIPVALYGQWGVATRLSASALPYRNFVLSWWAITALTMASIAWGAGLALREVNVDRHGSPSVVPRQFASSSAGGGRSTPTYATLAATVRHAATVWNSTTAVFASESTQPTDMPRAAAAAPRLDEYVQSVLRQLEQVVGSTATSTQLALEMDLIGNARLAYELANASNRTGGIWLPLAVSSNRALDVATASAEDASCIVSFCGMGAVLHAALSVDTTLASPTLPQSTVSGARRAAASLHPSSSRLYEVSGTPGGFHFDRCLNSGTAGSEWAELVGRTLGSYAAARTRLEQLATAYSSSDAEAAGGNMAVGTLAAASPLQAAVVVGGEVALSTRAEILDDNVVAAEALLTGQVRQLQGRTIHMKRRAVWGHVALALLAEGLLYVLWRLLFGAPRTPF